MTRTRPRHVLPTVIVAQFAGTSVWFATNAVIAELEAHLGTSGATAWLTGAVQLGFIAGTTALSVSGLADRFSPRGVFAGSCALAALANAATLVVGDLPTLLVARVLTGIALAGVYPIGMKVTAGWFRDGLGGALGWLVGALVVGTAFPHLLRGIAAGIPWQAVVVATSALALCGGGLLALLVPDGPYLKPAPPIDLRVVPKLWALPRYRSASLGYFGHMWELYTFWALLPAWLIAYTQVPSSLAAFAIIGAGALGCVGGGVLSTRWGSRVVARTQLAISAGCCALAPWIWGAPDSVVLAFLLVWGISVVGDSPQLSALSAVAAPVELIGTGLALATAVGFGLTVVSLQVASLGPIGWVPWILLPGPLLGLWALGAARERDEPAP